MATDNEILIYCVKCKGEDEQQRRGASDHEERPPGGQIHVCRLRDPQVPHRRTAGLTQRPRREPVTTYQSAYQLKMGRCSRCLRDNIPEDELFLAVGGEDGVGWQTVCQSCDDGDGSLRFHGKTIVELRDVTAFGSAEFDVRLEELSRMVDVERRLE